MICRVGGGLGARGASHRVQTLGLQRTIQGTVRGRAPVGVRPCAQQLNSHILEALVCGGWGWDADRRVVTQSHLAKGAYTPVPLTLPHMYPIWALLRLFLDWGIQKKTAPVRLGEGDVRSGNPSKAQNVEF